MENIVSQIQEFMNLEENEYKNVIIAIIVIIVSIIMSSLISFLIIKIFKLQGKGTKNIKEHPIYKSLRRILLLIGTYIAILILELPKEWFDICYTAIRILIIWNIAGLIIGLIAPDSKIVKKIKESNKIDEDNKVIDLLSKFGKFGIYTITIFIIISELHYDISSLITGLRTYKCSYSISCSRFNGKYNKWYCNCSR